MKQQPIKHFSWRSLRFVAVIPLAWLIGLLLLWGIYSLPNEIPLQHAQESAHIFWTEKTNHSWVPGGLPNVQQDNITDARIIGIAANAVDTGLSSLERALNQYLPHIPETDYSSCTHLAVYLSDPEQPVELYYYGRYWGGFALMARLWLYVCTYAQIRTANLILQLAVALLAVWAAWRALGWRGGVAVLIAYVALSPYTISRSMQYYPCFYLGFGGVFAVCRRARRKPGSIPWVFLILGILTAYLDFLTYPTVVVCLPLMIWLALNPGKDKIIARMLGLGILWALGYVGMWAGKWLLCSIAGLEYSGHSVSEKLRDYTVLNVSSFWDVLSKPFLAISKKRLLLLCLPTLAAAAAALRCLYRRQSVLNTHALCFGLIMLVPLMWIYITQGHSVPHVFLCNRNLAVFFAAAFLMASNMVHCSTAAHERMKQ